MRGLIESTLKKKLVLEEGHPEWERKLIGVLIIFWEIIHWRIY